MTLQAQIYSLVERIADKFSGVDARIGTLGQLDTAAKANLVIAINELAASVTVLLVTSAGRRHGLVHSTGCQQHLCHRGQGDVPDGRHDHRHSVDADDSNGSHRGGAVEHPKLAHRQHPGQPACD